jgi:pantothenate kinase
VTTFADLVARAAALAGPIAVLGITGSPGSGKTTLAAALARAVDGAVHVPMDGFHLADRVLDALGRRDAKGAEDTFDVGGYSALLRRLRAGTEDVVYAPAFERDLEQPLAGAIAVPRGTRLVVTEGNYLLLERGRWPEVAAQLDEVWFCAPDPAVRLRRLTARHVAFGKPQDVATAWVAAVDEPNAEMVETTRARADLVVGPELLEAVPR